MRGCRVHTHGHPHLRIPVVLIRGRCPGTSHDTHETVLAFDRCFETIPSKNQHLRIACNGLRGGTSRQGYFGFPVRHQVFIERGHLRIMCLRILCHGSAHHTEYNKQREVFDCACVNVLFPHCFSSSESRRGAVPLSR